MAFITSLVVGFALFYAGYQIFKRTPSNPFIDSLRIGKAHFLCLGIATGMMFPETTEIFRPFEIIRYNLIGAILLWFGLQTGLSTNFQRLRITNLQTIYSQTATILATGFFTVLAALASGPVLYRHLGLIENLPLAIVVLTSFALTARFSEPIFRWKGRGIQPQTADQTLPFNDIAALGLLTVAFPFLAEDPIFYLGDLTFVGATGFMLLLASLGILGGIALDFSFRSHRTGSGALNLSFAILISLFGLSQAPGLPSLAVGFIAGTWLINTTISKREVTELTARANDAIEPIFYVLMGTIVGGFGGGRFFLLAPLVPLATMMILVRAMGRMIGLTIAQTVSQTSETWRELLSLSFLPQNTLAVAVSMQVLYMLDFEHHTLIAGLPLAVFLGQVILIPPLLPVQPQSED